MSTPSNDLLLMLMSRAGFGLGCLLMFTKDYLCLNGGHVVRHVLFCIIVYRWFRCLIRCQDSVHLGIFILATAHVNGITVFTNIQ